MRTIKQIPAFRLVPEPLPPEAAELVPRKWTGPEVGKRHQLGSEPAFQQSDEAPMCSSCGEPMTFYGRLDSISDEFVLADAGLVLVFVCFDCFTSTSFIQSG